MRTVQVRLKQRLMVMALVFSGAALGGCSWLFGDEGMFRDRGDEYRKAQSIPPMKVPEGKRAEAVEELYAIPVERTDVLFGKEFEVPRPQPLVADPDQNVVRIQKLADEQWILLDGAPAEVWPRVRAFLISNQIGIEREDAATGVLETGWLVFKENPNRRERYRYRVDQGVQRNSTEIYVLQSGYLRPEGEDTTAPDWDKHSVDAARETFMLKELAGYLADTSGAGSVSLLAQGISTTNKVYLIRDSGGHPAIDLRLPFERAWASLGRALPRADFVVRDLDRTAGIYYVTYKPGSFNEDDEQAGDGAMPQQEEKKGFFSGLFNWWGDDENNPAAGREYRVQMRDSEGGVVIAVAREDGTDFEEGEIEFLLSLIKGHLS